MFITNVRGVGPTYYNKWTVHFQIMISNNLKKTTDNVCDIRIFTFNDLIYIKPVSKKKIIKKGE